MASYDTWVECGSIFAKAIQSGLRTSIVYGSKEDNGVHGHLVIIAGSVVYNRTMPDGTKANLGSGEIGFYWANGSSCTSYAILGSPII